MSALVSAVIPTYNRAEYVGGAIESALNQTYDDVQVVVVNDGSTDDTRDVLSTYEGDDRVKVRHNEENRGIPTTMNRGIDAADGKYVGVFGDDDRWRPTKVEKQVAVLEDAPDNYCGAYTDGVITDTEGEVVRRVESGVEGKLFPHIFVEMSVLPHSSQLVRKECLEAVDGFDESFEIACDWDLTARLAEEYCWKYVPEVLVERTHHEDNVTGDADYDVRARRQMYEKHRETIVQHSKVHRKFEAARKRELGLRALESDERFDALRSFATASANEPRLDHAALLALSPFGMDAISSARQLKDDSDSGEAT